MAQDVVKEVRQEGNATVLVLAGDVDMERSVFLREKMLDVMAEKPAKTVINMSEVPFMDSSGLATLVEALQLAKRHKTKLCLTGVQQRVRSVFEISRLDTIFELYETEAEALAS